MVRLEPKRRPPNFLTRRHQVRLLAVIFALAFVLWAMDHLRRPETAARWGEFFAPSGADQVDRRVTDVEIKRLIERADGPLPADAFRMPRIPTDNGGNPSDLASSVQPELLESIRDNSFFRSEETRAWFHLWQILQASTAAELAAASLGEIGYAQLIDQPRAYRGQVVTVRGTVRRVEAITPAPNEIGLNRLYLLTLRPPGGQIWPIRVYTLALPSDFPDGDDPRAEVVATGLFFKNWSYQWQEGLGLAPVVLARDVAWLDLPPTTAAHPARPSLVVVTLGAIALAVVLIGYIAWNVRIPPSNKQPASRDDVVRAMQQAAGEDRR